MLCEGNTIRPEGSSSCTPCETGTLANEEKTECGNLNFIKKFPKLRDIAMKRN